MNIYNCCSINTYYLIEVSRTNFFSGNEIHEHDHLSFVSSNGICSSWCIARTISLRAGVTKIQLAGRIWPTDKFNLARLAHSFQAPHLWLWTAVYQHWLLPGSCWLVCRSST